MIEYKCLNTNCNNTIKSTPSRVGHKRYCSEKCKIEYKKYLKNITMNKVFNFICKKCGCTIPVKRDKYYHVTKRKLCDKCLKLRKIEICAKMTKLEQKKYKSNEKYRNKKLKILLYNAKNPTTETRKKISEAGRGRKYSTEAKANMRNSYIKRMAEKIGEPIFPNFNPAACKLIEKYGKKHGYNFQHALNGGEFHIKELGYWVDGYDKNKNVIIEIDERHHFDSNGNLKEKDIHRQNEIIEHLKCEFIRLEI